MEVKAVDTGVSYLYTYDGCGGDMHRHYKTSTPIDVSRNWRNNFDLETIDIAKRNKAESTLRSIGSSEVYGAVVSGYTIVPLAPHDKAGSQPRRRCSTESGRKFIEYCQTGRFDKL